MHGFRELNTRVSARRRTAIVMDSKVAQKGIALKLNLSDSIKSHSHFI